ncbi:hypothetical protein G9E11_03140 [Arthrobacter sp. IA7]|nr:hypothetical protein [Arthrobacter ipis]
MGGPAAGRGRGGGRVLLARPGLAFAVVDVPGFDLVVFVVGFGFVGARLAEDLAAQGVRKEGLHVGRIGSNHKVQQVSGGGVVGDQVGRGVADTKVQNLHVPGALPRGHFAGTLSHLIGVVRAGHQDADRTVQHLVHTVQHQILVMRAQHCGRDLVAAAKY